MATVTKYFCDCCGEEIKKLSDCAVICNIRQLGEHCISETRCIMCDMEDKDD